MTLNSTRPVKSDCMKPSYGDLNRGIHEFVGYSVLLCLLDMAKRVANLAFDTPVETSGGLSSLGNENR